MKKLFIGVFALGLAGGTALFIQGNGDGASMVKTFENVVDDFVGNSKPKTKFKTVKSKMKLSEYLAKKDNVKIQDLVAQSEGKEETVFKASQKVLSKTIDCVKKETCLNKDTGTLFYDKSNDPVLTKIKNNLELIEVMSLNEPDFLKRVSDKDLIDIIDFGHKSSTFLSFSMLMKKGKESFSKTFEPAKSFRNVQAKYYLSNFRGMLFEGDEEVRSQRNEVINSYLDSHDLHTVNVTLKELTKIPTSESEAMGFMEKACRSLASDGSDADKQLKSKIKKLARGFEKSPSCI